MMLDTRHDWADSEMLFPTLDILRRANRKACLRLMRRKHRPEGVAGYSSVKTRDLARKRHESLLARQERRELRKTERVIDLRDHALDDYDRYVLRKDEWYNGPREIERPDPSEYPYACCPDCDFGPEPDPPEIIYGQTWRDVVIGEYESL